MKKLIIILVIILGYLSYDTIKSLPKKYNLNSETINDITIEIQKREYSITIDDIPNNTILIYSKNNRIGILPNKNVLKNKFNNNLEILNSISSTSINNVNSIDEALFECKSRVISYLSKGK